MFHLFSKTSYSMSLCHSSILPSFKSKSGGLILQRLSIKWAKNVDILNASLFDMFTQSFPKYITKATVTPGGTYLRKVNVGKNIEKALKQSMKRFIDGDTRDQKGVAAIDLSHLINPDQEFLITDNINKIADRIKISDEIYAPEVKRHFDKYGEHCLSVIFHWRIPVCNLKECVGLYERCFSVPIFKSGTSSEDVFNRLNSRLINTVGL